MDLGPSRRSHVKPSGILTPAGERYDVLENCVLPVGEASDWSMLDLHHRQSVSFQYPMHPMRIFALSLNKITP